MSDVELDYPFLMDAALRSVVRDVLNLTKELGSAPGEHHFYIEFATQAAGVDIPDSLLMTYPERMTIVLQHQFKDLEITDERFSVTLWFKGEPSHLVIPFDAITIFADPSVQFELRFSNFDTPAVDDAETAVNEAAEADDNEEPDPSADIVSLDAFRKK
ncbi:MAG: hypothetical protein EVA70_06490 [Parvularculaceae bacterium]|nr:MAG: hypothetical protein EVA70_06490 [Parvularculaceae bacterium]